MKLFRRAAWFTLLWAQMVWAGSDAWRQPAAALADQVAAILGPGQVRLTINNLSSIPAAEMPSIRKLLEQNLKAHGINPAGAESANSLRITLSENARERLWVAEVVQGSVTQVAMVSLPAGTHAAAHTVEGLALRSEAVLTADAPVVSLLDAGQAGMIAVEPDRVAWYAKMPGGGASAFTAALREQHPFARDAHGAVAADGEGFNAWLPGELCTGSLVQPDNTPAAPRCKPSDDPWPIAGAQGVAGATQLKAFYNANRNFFTGVVTPGLGVDLPPFYSAVLIPRAAGGAALLIGGTDGKVLLVENTVLKPVSGTRDWGSDFATLTSGCGVGTQVIASSSGAAATDSLRAYELPALEAVPVSAPFAMGGAVTALWTAADGKSVYATVRRSANEYEVDRVTASCN